MLGDLGMRPKALYFFTVSHAQNTILHEMNLTLSKTAMILALCSVG